MVYSITQEDSESKGGGWFGEERIIRERREMTNIPKDPIMLLSYINTQLRDNYPDMDELCRTLCLERKDVDEKLASIDYEYDPEKNQYV